MDAEGEDGGKAMRRLDEALNAALVAHETVQGEASALDR